MDTPSLPITRKLSLAYVLSVVIALLMTCASLAGLFFQTALYPSDELRRSFVSNDVVNLFVGLPILLGSMWLTGRGKLIGLLFWPGALFYVLYNYLVYLFAVPLTLMFLPYLALVTLSVYTMIGLVASLDGEAIRQQVRGAVPEQFAGGVLVGLGGLFFFRVIGVIIIALTNQMPIARAELALHVTDFIITPAWIISGIMLWRREAFGYVSGLGVLLQASTLFVGLIIFMILQPFLSSAPFVLSDVIVIFVMGLICFIPFGIFVHGIITKK